MLRYYVRYVTCLQNPYSIRPLTKPYVVEESFNCKSPMNTFLYGQYSMATWSVNGNQRILYFTFICENKNGLIWYDFLAPP